MEILLIITERPDQLALHDVSLPAPRTHRSQNLTEVRLMDSTAAAENHRLEMSPAAV